MLRITASLVPPKTSTERISVGKVASPLKPINPAGTTNSISEKS